MTRALSRGPMFLALTAAAALSLSACNTTSGAVGGYHDAVKAQAIAAYFNPTIGGGVGSIGVTVDRSANVDKNGNAIVVHGACKDDSPSTYANMNSKATASANNVSQPVAAAAAGLGGAVAGVVSAPALAVATGDVTANGGPAIIAAASQTEHPADVIAAYCQNATLPSAAPGQIVRDGVSPAVAAAK